MIIAAAQTIPKIDDIQGNIRNHIHLAKIAARNGADLILFPEMSLTSYERKNAKRLVFKKEDPRLAELEKTANICDITIVAGAPISYKNELHIGCFIIQPNQKTQTYFKHHLHGEENDYFISSTSHNPVINIKNEQLSMAICADINHEEHIISAKNEGSTIHLAGIFFNNSEMKKAHSLLGNYALKQKINVLMANFTGEVWNMIGGGKSAFWSSEGELIGELNEKEATILLVKKQENHWKKINVTS